MDSEEYLSLWYTPASSGICPFLSDEESFISESYVFKSFRSEFEVDKCFTPKALKAHRDAENNSDYSTINNKATLGDYIPGYSLLSFIPKKSVLNKAEMNECFEIVQLQASFKQLTPLHHEKLNYYKDRVKAEQREFLGLAKSQWTRENFTRHKEILPDVEKFVNNLWQDQLERVRTYPKFYSQSSLISLAPAGVDPKDPVDMTFLAQLAKIGTPPRLYQPNLHYVKININKNVEDLTNAYISSKKALENKLTNDTGYHPEVSKDKNAERLAVENNVQIVMSASVFLCLMDNHYPHFLATWDIPITVKEHLTGHGLKQKVVYLDKPFTSRTMNQFERKSKYAKVASDFVLRYKSGVSRLKRNDTYEGESEWTAGDNQTELADGSLLEKDSDSSDNSDLSLAADWNYASNPSSVPSSSQSLGQYPFQANPSLHMGAKKASKKKFLQSVTYNLWKIHKSSPSYLSKNVSKDLNILIRAKEGHLKKDGRMSKVLAKCEYQPEFGAEVVSLSELTRQWASVIIRPNTSLLRVRLNPIDGEVIMFEDMTAAQLGMESQRLYEKNLTKCLCSLQAVLEKLSDLTPGTYLFAHRPANSAFAHLYKSTNGNYDVSLHSSYHLESSEVAPERATWNQLDVHIINPTFAYFHRVPAMFAPCKAFSNNHKKKNNPRLNKDMKGKGNRRKGFKKRLN